ncbi:tetratricopeptide repeat protein [Mesorhizobium sp. M0633]|uniref:tetratricopeptide repeat protein n=1 Tax=Mesorhizobium sp. M0633 TaxID=2956977 RepID=UPI00333B1E2D
MPFVELTGLQQLRLRKALRTIFVDEAGFDALLLLFDTSLADISSTRDRFPDRIQSVIGEAQAKGWLLDLIGEARQQVPDDPALKQLEEELTARTLGYRARQLEPPPKLWNVPRRQNRYFTGRTDLLKSLRDALCSGDPTLSVQALCGLGGVGKTQLAAEYAFQNAGDYRLVWWIKAESLATLASDFARLANELGLASVGLAETGTYDQPHLVSAVRRWLETNDGWLLIFDNAAGPQELSAYLPQAEIGHVLITTQNLSWQGQAEVVVVPELTPSSAVEFLLKRTKSKDAASAEQLASALGELPLALEHAGAYIDSSGCLIREYLTLFVTKKEQIFQRFEAPPGYPFTIATTWELAFKRIPSEAAELLHLCTFLAPEGISRALLRNGAQCLPLSLARSVTDHLEWNDIMQALRRYSLLYRRDDVLRIHRLVQFVLLHRMKPDERCFWADVAVRLVADAFPRDEGSSVSLRECESLLPHALAACGWAEALNVQAEKTCLLLTKVGHFLRIRAQYAESKSVLERALKIADNTYPKGHPEVAAIINSFGRTLHSLGENAKARRAFHRSLKDYKACYGTSDPQVARGYNDYGSVLLTCGKPKSAIKFIYRAMHIDESIHGRSHPDVARDRGNLGRALHALGDLNGGRNELEKALRIHEAHFGPNDPRVADALSNLGLVFRSQHNITAAQACFARSLQIREQVLGKQHPSTLRVRDRLTSLARAPAVAEERQN